MMNKLTEKNWFWWLVLAVCIYVGTFCLALLDWAEAGCNGSIIDVLKTAAISSLAIAVVVGVAITAFKAWEHLNL